MRILLTGVSSFTGAWMATALAGAGHEVVGTLQRPRGAYPPLSQQRLAMAAAAGVTLAEGPSYGTQAFLALVERGWDVLAYHGADVRDYRSADFDLFGALERNTRGARELCRRAVAAGVGRLIVTGTVFEPFAGTGDQPERAVTPYGLSKALSWEVMRFFAEEAGLPVGKFIVANPFGPLEQERFCSYLARSWLAGQTAEVRTPDYVRDNVPVDQLAAAYTAFAALPPGDPAAVRAAPSGYVGSQGEFTARFAREIGPRLGVATPFTLAEQTDFSEPLVRIATDPVAAAWDEGKFWDALAEDYARRFAHERISP
ncbi:MAG: NAD(P)-dependent oxidoreductase [Novosphingobium sp.]|nr:NAD(P)-dependent oxidoreductase [Novosphingobium sp.]